MKLLVSIFFLALVISVAAEIKKILPSALADAGVWLISHIESRGSITG
jgi:hypothetical protein